MPDAVFDDRRLAGVYDALDPDRRDLDAYVMLIDEVGARRIVDVGCGTGTLAIRLARRRLDVTGVDPAVASLAVARRKPFAELVRRVDGDAVSLATRQPTTSADVVVMTGNVAQVFVSDRSWADTLSAVRTLLADHGRFVFETRVPERRAWEHWNGPGADVDVPGIGRVSDSYVLQAVDERDDGDVVVTFSSPTRFHGDGVAPDVVIDSVSTLRFRTRRTIDSSLAAAGFRIQEVRDAPDRPGAEWMFIATCGPPTTDRSDRG